MAEKEKNNGFELEASIFKALSHSSRLQIINELSEGSKCVNDLHEVVGGDISTVSRHISVLKNAGIVSGNKSGLQVFYSLDMACVAEFVKCIGSKDENGFEQEPVCCERLKGEL